MEIQAAILHYCKYQERCQSEVRSKLYELGATTIEVEQQISLLIENGVVNEERFARAFAGGKFRMKQWGRVKVKQQLKQRNISDYCIKKAMTEIDVEDYETTLKKLALKKLAEVRSEKSVALKKHKIYKYLIQKGYESSKVIEMINDFLEIS